LKVRGFGNVFRALKHHVLETGAQNRFVPSFSFREPTS
jgi:hypothetical protein